MTRYTKYHKKFNNAVGFISNSSEYRSDPSVNKSSFSGRVEKHTFKHKNTNLFQNNDSFQRPEKYCFRCRKSGHLAKFCDQLDSAEQNTDLCYVCGSTEHTSKDCLEQNDSEHGKSRFKFATCFVCKEKGHLASECERNPNGIYPNGGNCRFCGSNKHMAKNCDSNPAQKQKQSNSQFGDVDNDALLVPDTDDTLSRKNRENNNDKPVKKKIVKF